MIGFDYPSHGKTYGWLWDNLDEHSFASLTGISTRVLRLYRTNAETPLLIAGWSTGGLHAIRIAQTERVEKQVSWSCWAYLVCTRCFSSYVCGQ